MLPVSLSLIRSLPHVYLLLLILACGGDIGQAANITLGSRLTPTLTAGWASSSGTFRLAFYAVEGSSPATYSVGVLYGTVSKQTVAWTAGGNVKVGTGASLELRSDGNLVLLPDASAAPVWNSSTADRNITGAKMQDDGNFVLYNESGAIEWQSFDTPTDTLVENQPLNAGQSLQNGLYAATMAESGNFSLAWMNGSSSVSYWSSYTSKNSGVGSAPYAALQTNGTFGIIEDSQGISLKSWTSNDFNNAPGPSVRRLTLDADGNLRIYSWFTTGTVWSTGWEALEECEVYGYCGDKGLCTYNSSEPACVCVEEAGFTYIDPSNTRRGCKASVLGAEGSNCTTGIGMVRLNNTVLSSSSILTLNYGETICQTSCLQNPLCVAATAYNDGSRLCIQLVSAGTTFSGYQEPGIPSTSFFKFCGTLPPSSSVTAPSAASSNSSKFSLPLVIVVCIVATLAIVLAAQGGLWFCYCRNNPKFGGYSSHYALLEYASGAPVQFTYKELRSATHNFSEKLGEGGFGTVYKGSLRTEPTRTEVAVKQLESIDQGEKQFRMEVAIIGSTHHMNLVRLCGFCAERKHRLLVYEYMQNGSLDRYLFADASSSLPNLDWPTRFNILLGTACGIRYLHQECRDCIIHCDIKPENILLDENFCAKVSDFGLAKLTNPKDRARNHVSMLVRGTRGYLAPEWRSNLPITVKSDVYSFGMVMLETVSGRKSFDTTLSSSARQSFSEWAFHQYFEHKDVQSVVDPRVQTEQLDMEEVDRALKVAFCCMQVQPSLRPSMSKVLQMLQGTLPVDTPQMPQLFRGLHNEEVLVESLEPQQGTPSSSSSLKPFNQRNIAEHLSRSLIIKQTSQTSSSPPSHYSMPLG